MEERSGKWRKGMKMEKFNGRWRKKMGNKIKVGSEGRRWVVNGDKWRMAWA